MRHDAPDQPGATVRRYRVERLIGTGSAGAVYEARRLGPNGPGERVACKVMHADQRNAPGFRRLIWHEAVVGLRFTAGHPNLVQILDFFDDAQEQLCIVMELVDGACLEELRPPGQRWPFPIARRIAIEVLEALLHLHGRNVLYRDLSMHNILVAAGGAVKLTDFGIARVMEQGQVRTSEIRGTPVYLSPEAIEGRPLDARSDLFSLGAVLYDLVTGQPPCGNHELRGAVFVRTLYGPFPPLPPDTPEDLAELITGLIEKDRETRWPQTAAEALALLRSHDQPLASPEELAALVGPVRERRDQALASKHPSNLLPPGHVLELRDDPDPAERAGGEPPGHVVGNDAPVLSTQVAEKDARALPAHETERGPGALPERVTANELEVLPAGVAEVQANPLPDLVAYFGADRIAKIIDDLPDHPSPDLFVELESGGTPELAAERAGDAVPEHIDDGLPDALADHAPVPDPPADVQPGRVAEGASDGTLHRQSRLVRRFVTRSVAFRATIGACVLVLGSLLDDGFRRGHVAIELQQRPGASGLVAKPEPAAPVASAPAPARRSPRRALDPTDGPRHDRIETQRHDQHTRPPARRREYVPPASEWPPWVQR